MNYRCDLNLFSSTIYQWLNTSFTDIMHRSLRFAVSEFIWFRNLSSLLVFFSTGCFNNLLSFRDQSCAGCRGALSPNLRIRPMVARFAISYSLSTFSLVRAGVALLDDTVHVYLR